jgi:hypothetical protein
LESGNDAIDLALWQLLRDVLLWARTPVDERVRLFDPPGRALRQRIVEAAEAAPLLADPLAALARLRLETGESAAFIASACDRVYEWAERSGLIRIATHFAEASAYADPGSPVWACRAGYMTRTTGGMEMFIRSETWYSRGYLIAVQRGNDDAAIRALVGTGALAKDMGQYGRARHFYMRAVRRALRRSRDRQAAVVLHYSFALAIETDHVRLAVRDANAALRYYPLHDERIPAFAHDVAYLLIRNNHYGTALRLVDGLGDRAEGFSIMGSLYGITARAAAGAGFGGSYFAASDAALNIAQINEECAGAVYVNLAEAARILRRWDEAREHASAALAVARRRMDVEVERLAAELLRRIEQREPPPPASEPLPDTPIGTLARRLAARLKRWRRYRRGAGIQG